MSVLQAGRRDTISGTPGPDGYRDIKVNVDLGDGLVGELQINLTPMLQAKELAHPLYNQRLLIEQAIKNRLPSDDELRAIDTLNAQMNLIYSAAWDR